MSEQATAPAVARPDLTSIYVGASRSENISSAQLLELCLYTQHLEGALESATDANRAVAAQLAELTGWQSPATPPPAAPHSPRSRPVSVAHHPYDPDVDPAGVTCYSVARYDHDLHHWKGDNDLAHNPARTGGP